MNKRISSQADLFFKTILFLLIFFMAIRLPLDTDFWWHLRSGQETIRNGFPLMKDIFSYTKYGTGWINHSWLSQVIFYLIFSIGKLPGIMILVALVVIVSLFLIFETSSANTLLRAFVLVLIAMVTSVIWTPRPQLFTFLFLSFEFWFLLTAKKTNKQKRVYWLLPLFVFWSNLHAGFSLGIILLGLFIVGELVEGLLNDSNSNVNDKEFVKSLFLVFAVSFFVVCINPNGINVWLIQFKTISIEGLQNFISEWASPDFHVLFQQPYLWAWLILFFFVASVNKRIGFFYLFPVIFFGALGFISRRNFGPFGVVVFAPLCNSAENFFDLHLRSYWERLKIKSWSNKKFNEGVNKFINLFISSIILLFIMGKIYWLSNPLILDSYERDIFPKTAVEFINQKSIEGNMLNSYSIGGYLIWNLPQHPVFIDGRTDLYGDKLIQDWLILMNANKSWEQLIDYYGIGWVFLEPDRPLVDELIENHWDILYRDDQAIILETPK